MKVVFMGTPDFAVPALRAICDSRHQVMAVVTKPDKPGNRGKMTPPPVKAEAERLGIRVYQYSKISREGLNDLKELCPDIIVTAAFGQILSREILAVAPYGVINIHASLLPKYRGSSPIQWAVLNGEEYTGITIMQTAYEVDSGDIIKQYPLKIDTKDTAGSIFDKLSEIGARAVVEVLDLIDSGKAVFTPQNEYEATYCRMLTKSDGLIDFNETRYELDCFVRGMYPWPNAYFIYNGENYRVFSVQPIEYCGCEEPGVILSADSTEGLIVRCLDGAVRLAEIQAPSSRRMSDTEYLRGHKLEKINLQSWKEGK